MQVTSLRAGGVGGQLGSASELPEGQCWRLVFMPGAYSVYQRVSCGQLAPELVFRLGVGGGGPKQCTA